MKKFLIGIVMLVAAVMLSSPAFGALASVNFEPGLSNSGVFMFYRTGNNDGAGGPTIGQMETFINDWFENDGSTYNYGPISGLAKYEKLDGFNDEGSSGTWETDSPINFYGLKAGNGYAMYWVEPPSTTGAFSTYDGKDLSHITFYTANPVPVPAAVWLLGSGVLGLVAVRRRRS